MGSLSANSMPTRLKYLFFLALKISPIVALLQPYYYNNDILCFTPIACISGFQKLLYEEYVLSKPQTDRSDSEVLLTPGMSEFNPETIYFEETHKQKPRDTVENPACYVQTCEQFITGRNLRYQEALRIIQDEAYLDAADFEM